MSDVNHGIVRDYEDLALVLNRVREIRNMSCEELDRIAGWPDRLATKALTATPPIRKLGPKSIRGGIEGLGIMLIAVDDPEAMAKYTAKAQKRDARQVRVQSGGLHGAVTIKISRRKLRRLAAMGGKKRWAKLSEQGRTRLAKRLAKARWGKKSKSPVSDCP